MPAEIDLDAVLLPARARSDETLADIAAWHLVDVMDTHTWCGTGIEFGALRRPWSAIPDLQRCQLCAEQI